MVKYTLLHKPRFSGWPTIPRQLKIILAITVFTAASFFIIAQSSTRAKLIELYNLQESLAVIFDLELKYMPDIEINELWLPVGVPQGHIYSAYLDMRPEVVLNYKHLNYSRETTWAEIRIIAVLDLERNDKPLMCHYKYKNDGTTDFVFERRPATKVKAMDENWNLKYSAFFVLCDLTLPKHLDYATLYNKNHFPVGVTISEDRGVDNDEYTGKPEKVPFVNITYPMRGTIHYYENDMFLSVCVPALHSNYNRALFFVEFIEYYLMMGAGHFTFYNSSVSPEVNKILEYYTNNGIATTLQWKLPPYYIYEKTLRDEGIFAALNDCMYRSSYYRNYKYVAGVDVDEFLIPRVHNNFYELMRYLDPEEPERPRNRHASFLFRNAFFYTIHDDDLVNKDTSVPYLYTQAKTQRVKTINEPRYRSKYIVRSQDVVELGNHNVWEFRKGFDEVAVDTDIALSHHYRYCEGDTVKCYLTKVTVDKTAHRFTKKLGQKVRSSCQNIFGSAGCPKPTD
ncbi:uncharacterized protein LOC107265042 [Cephus cinctus]|uniref:Glycosyltransferase family 92 protein n=1 Tax=Cephus cinctus TaxID=211228 RepID=A0AAJ7FFN6_CEPCN|nr:uncharacterized protein LOC107265042 [Cephus cinctus]